MFLRPFFADANSSYEESDFVIFGVPFDGTSSFRSGARNAPSEMRRASYNFETYINDYKVDLLDVKICDLGDLEVSSDVKETLKLVEEWEEKILGDGKIPIMLGGEHSLSYACVKCFKSTGVVVLDAHFDLRSDYMGVKFNHACVSNHIVKHVGRQNYVSIGIRSGTGEEYSFADKNLHYYSSAMVASMGIEKVVREAQRYLKPKNIYLSIDLDAVDPAYAPAVSTPEPFGLSPWDLREVIRAFAHRVAGFDLVEIAPGYDHGETALLGAKLVREFIAAKAAGDERLK